VAGAEIPATTEGPYLNTTENRMIRFKEYLNSATMMTDDLGAAVLFRQAEDAIVIGFAKGSIGPLIRILRAFPVKVIVTHEAPTPDVAFLLKREGFSDCQNGRWVLHV
jgi:hypothetical protein